MLFDTGASMSHISNDFAQNCKVVGKVQSAGQTGIFGETTEVKEILNIKIDGLQISKHHFIVDEKAKNHFSCDGVLGIDLLSKCNLKINFRDNYFEFISDKISNGIPFITHRNKIFFTPRINGNEIKNVIFDTGAHNLSIEKDLYRKLNLELLENDKELGIGDSNDNLIDFETYRIKSFEIGSFKKHNIISYGYCFKNSSKLKKIKQNGIIGKNIFGLHIFTFDFKSKLCKIE